MSASRTIQSKINTIDSIATLPTVAAEVLQTMRSHDASMRDIATVIERDPSITARVLKVANSPIWGYSAKVESVQRGLVILGIKQVTNIVIAVSLYSTFAKMKPNLLFDRDKFWVHSIGTAQIARKLSRQLGMNFQGEEFVGGLLHDIGKIILDQYWTDDFNRIMKTASENSTAPRLIEQESLGYGHTEVGARLLEKWNFPASIVQAVEFHHDPFMATSHGLLTATISTADIICQGWEIGQDPDVQGLAADEERGWLMLQRKAPNARDFDLKSFEEGMKDEVEEIQNFMSLLSS